MSENSIAEEFQSTSQSHGFRQGQRLTSDSIAIVAALEAHARVISRSLAAVQESIDKIASEIAATRRGRP